MKIKELFIRKKEEEKQEDKDMQELMENLDKLYKLTLDIAEYGFRAEEEGFKIEV